MVLNKEFFIVYDYILIIWALCTFINAYKKGGFLEIFEILSTIVSIVVGYLFYKPLSFEYPLWHGDAFLSIIHIDSVIWFFILFLGCKMVFGLIIHLFRDKDKKPSFISRLVGFVLAAIKVAIVYGLIVLLCLSSFVENGNRFVNQGPLYYVKEFMIDHRKDVGIDV